MNKVSNSIKRFFTSPLSRISFGLVMLTVSLLLVSDLLGLWPDQRQAELEYRKFIAESFAVQASLEINERDSSKLKSAMESVVSRNPRVRSIALRQSNGELLHSVGQHTSNWLLPADGISTIDQVRVSLYTPQGVWGDIELVFQPFTKSSNPLSGAGSIVWVILYLAVAGFVGFYFFLKKVLRELDPNQVLPERVRSALDSLAEGLMILDGKGFIMFSNEALSRKIGIQSSKLVGQSTGSMSWFGKTSKDRAGPDVSDRELEEYELPWMRVLGGGEAGQDNLITLVVAGNREYQFSVNVAPIEAEGGALRGVLVTLNDITDVEHKRVELQKTLHDLEISQKEITVKNEELYKLATRDSLTDVLNRRAFFEAFDTVFEKCQRDSSPLGCIMVDIDKFKSVNDNFGHSVGDTVICYLASVMVNHATDMDVVGRFGGEEFCMLLPGEPLESVRRRSEAMRLTIDRSQGASFSDQLQITASFGISALPSGAETPHQLLDRADRALYFSKENGRNQVSIWQNNDIVPSLPDTRVDVAASSVTLNQSASTEPEAQPAATEVTVVGATGSEPGFERRQSDQSRISTRAAGQSVSDDQEQGARVIVEPGYGVTERHLMIYSIDQASKRSRDSETILAVFVLDASPLRQITKAFGARAGSNIGDLLIDRLKNLLRNEDVISHSDRQHESIANSGGNVVRTDLDQISVLISNLDKIESVVTVVERLLKVFSKYFVIDGTEYLIETCIGISVLGVDATSAEQLLQNASVACSDAVSSGELNSYRFYARSVDEVAKRELRLLSDLPSVIENDELRVHFQPKVNLRSGRIFGFEALLRWQHPKLGMISPVEFIPLTEKSGLICSINQWVSQFVADQLRSWIDSGFEDLSVAINVSALELDDPTLAERLIAIKEERQLPDGAMEIEITESVEVESLENAGKVLKKLSKSGFTIAIDDFGTGYASLNYLQKFPISRVKIDRSFIGDVVGDPRKSKLVTAIISLSASLGMRVIAEGVEDEEQMKFLMEYHCDEIQGYLVSKPVDAESATQLLLDQQSIVQLVLRTQMDLGGQGRMREQSGLQIDGLNSVMSKFPGSLSAIASNEQLHDGKLITKPGPGSEKSGSDDGSDKQLPRAG